MVESSYEMNVGGVGPAVMRMNMANLNLKNPYHCGKKT